jgi:hypothetical protein
MKVNWATTSGGNIGGHQPKLDSSIIFMIMSFIMHKIVNNLFI